MRAGQNSVGKVSNSRDAPIRTPFRDRGKGGGTEAPDGKVEGEDGWHVGPGWSIVGKGKERVVESKGGWGGGRYGKRKRHELW